MKVMHIIGKSFLGFVLLLAFAFFYFDSDFYEIRRLKDQIELNLQLNPIDLPELLYRESYGWAEEGGDRSLMLLIPKVCSIVSLSMTGVEVPNQESDYLPIFAKNNVAPKIVKTWMETNSHGDFTFYALDEESCNLYRWYHYE